MAKKQRRIDAYGDPLAAGIRLRRGTPRLVTSSLTLVLSSDGSLLASGQFDGWISIFDAVTGELRHRLRSKSVTGRRHVWMVEHVAFSPDGARFAASYGGLVGLWDVGTGSQLWEARVDSDFTQPLAFSPDGLRIAAGRSPALLLDATDGKMIARSSLQADSLAFSRDGNLVCAAIGHTIQILPTTQFDQSDAARSVTLPNVPACSAMQDKAGLVPTMDGSRLLVAHLAGGLYELDLKSLSVLRHTPWPGEDRPFDLSSVALGQRVFVLCKHQLYQLEDRGFRALDGPERWACAISGDASTVAFQRRAGGVSYVDVANIDGSGLLTPRHDFHRVGTRIAWYERDGLSGLLLAEPGRMVVCDTVSGGELASWTIPHGWALVIDPRCSRFVLREAGETDHLRAMDGTLLAKLDDFRIRCLSPDGETWLAETRGDASTCLVIGSLNAADRIIWKGGQRAHVYATTFSPDGRLVAVGFYDQQGAIWNVREGERVSVLPERYLWTAAWSPRGDKLLCAFDGGMLRLWDCATQRWALELKVGRVMVSAVAWSADGQRFATAGSGIQVWTADGELMRKLPGKADSMVFTPDGTGLCVCAGGVVEIWNL